MKTRHISFEQITLSPGFWQKRQEINAHQTIPAVYDRFAESGRFEALQTGHTPPEWSDGRCMTGLQSRDALRRCG